VTAEYGFIWELGGREKEVTFKTYGAIILLFSQRERFHLLQLFLTIGFLQILICICLRYDQPK
jgi:hypothetical protein